MKDDAREENTEKPEGLLARIRSNRWAGWAMDLTILAAVFFLITAWQTRDLIGDGEPAPDFTLGTLANEAVSLDDLKGKPTVLVFWAPWCGVCGAESSTISSLRDHLEDEGNVISVALEYDDVAEVEAFIAKYDVDYPVLLGNNAIVNDYKIHAFPTVYILDDEGKIASTLVGYTSTLGFRWRVWLAS